MLSNYKRIGDYIQEVNIRNTDLKIDKLIGVSIEKKFISSVANIVGTDMSVYKIIKKNQLACKLMSVGRDEKLPVDLYLSDAPAIISSAYYVFETKNHEVLLPEFLKMWLFRKETDRYVGYISGGDVRGGISWDTFCDMPIIIPSIEKQREIVNEYNTIQKRIELNNQLIQKLEDTAQTIYKQWFVEFEFPDKNGKPYKSSGGKMVWCEELEREIPEDWKSEKINDFSKVVMGQSPLGESYNENGVGIALINGPVEFGNYFTVKTKWTIEPKKYCEKNDLILCVRGSTVGKIVISDDKYAIGRGVCAIKSKYPFFNLLMIKNNLNTILKDVTGSTFPNLDRKTLEEFKIVIGNYALILTFETKFKSLNETIKLLHTQSTILEELKDLLLAKMTRGEKLI